METFDNPYFHWNPIRDQMFFHDREEETRQVLWSIGHGQCVSLVGPRKIGKTSLLFHLQALGCDKSSTKKGGVVCVYIDGQAHHATRPSEFYSEVLDRVCGVLAQEGEPILPAERPQEKMELSYLRRAVRSFIRRGVHPVLLIDEFDVLCENHNFDLAFFNGLRSQATLGVVYVTASKHTLFQLDRDQEILGSPFFNYFRPMYIGLFGKASSVELIREPAARCGIRFDEQTVQEISRLAGGHPFFLQRVCYIAFEMCRRKKGTLGHEDYERMRAKSQQELEEQMARYWEDLGLEERQILFKVATGEALQEDSAVTPDNLVRKCLLVKSNGSHQIFSSLFKDCVCAQSYPEPLRPRKWLDRFEIKEPLGLSRRSTEPAGRPVRSRVYKAYQPLLDRDVVIKELTPRADIADEYAERFRLEAQSIARLDHPNILQVFDFYQESGRAYLVMKYASNGSLADRLTETKGPLGPLKAVEIVIYVGRALGYAHRQGIIHRDIKPANIFMGADDWPLLGDFGLAVSRRRASTEGAGMVGSSDYVAPEQAVEGSRADERSDIYSLGMVLYRLLVDEVPYAEDASAGDRLIRRLTQGTPTPRLRNPRISEEAERIVLKATASDPGDRYQMAEDLVEDLANVSVNDGMHRDSVYDYDVFVSYSHLDEDWVKSTLLPELEGADLHVCIDYRDFEVGAPSLDNIENAVERSRKTLLVLTSNWVSSEWTAFEALLIQTQDPASRGRRILPLLVKPCDLPLRLQVLTYLDLTDPTEFRFQMRQLVAAIR